ncbi:MAG: hypothetical protein M0Q91_05345 [Methanoregula sp.]|jgi:hypothetical protein|nr:hypothetical protein [Methanoregula sp.]
MTSHTSSLIILSIILLSLIAGVHAQNIYVPIPATTPDPYGTVYVDVRCQHGIYSSMMVLTSLTNNAASTVYLSPDGTWNTQLIPGDYALILLDGNMGRREYQFFTVQAGESAYVNFIGHAITGSSKIIPINPSPVPTVTPSPTPTVVPTISPIPVPTSTPICYCQKKGWWEDEWRPEHIVCPWWYTNGYQYREICE